MESCAWDDLINLGKIPTKNYERRKHTQRKIKSTGLYSCPVSWVNSMKVWNRHSSSSGPWNDFDFFNFCFSSTCFVINALFLGIIRSGFSLVFFFFFLFFSYTELCRYIRLAEPGNMPYKPYQRQCNDWEERTGNKEQGPGRWDRWNEIMRQSAACAVVRMINVVREWVPATIPPHEEWLGNPCPSIPSSGSDDSDAEGRLWTRRASIRPMLVHWSRAQWRAQQRGTAYRRWEHAVRSRWWRWDPTLGSKEVPTRHRAE